MFKLCRFSRNVSIFVTGEHNRETLNNESWTIIWIERKNDDDSWQIEFELREKWFIAKTIPCSVVCHLLQRLFVNEHLWNGECLHVTNRICFSKSSVISSKKYKRKIYKWNIAQNVIIKVDRLQVVHNCSSKYNINQLKRFLIVQSEK